MKSATGRAIIATKRHRGCDARDLPESKTTKASAEATNAPPMKLVAWSSAWVRPTSRHPGKWTCVDANTHANPAATMTVAIPFQNQAVRNTSSSRTS